MALTSLEGQTLGKYRILEPLGSGGMARVYRGYHAQLDRFVAIKVLRSDLVEDGTFLVRFRHEAQAVATLRHANIIQVHDFDVEDGLYFMVMELLDGDTLHTRLNEYRVREEQMPWGEMMRILLDVLAGLGYAHQAGMVHRDIKPANILLTQQGQAVLADFGIAQIVGGTRHTVSGALLGTLNYMAPEQGLEGTSDVRSDLYSLGVVLYEMLTRQPPYDADTPLAILLKHVNDPLPLPRELNPAIPEPLERIVLKALAKEPDGRFQSAAEMTEALQQAVIEAKIDLPAQISLPLSFATADAPAESVAVYSGASRAKLADVEFAAHDTSAARVGADLAALKANEPPVAKVTASDTPVAAPTSGQDSKAILNGLGLILLVNLTIVMFSGRSGPSWFYERGWPVELFLVAIFFLQMMIANGNLWLFIPGGLFFGEAVLMSYYALTGNWDAWAFLWPLQVFIIFGVLWFTINRATPKSEAQQLAVSVGKRYRRAAIILSFIVFFITAVG
ncbi:MAG: serine/threonine protein kinase [Chloroflexi bacterium]|nr:serine/threonine protein kinase [Chloroflexota bacterium]